MTTEQENALYTMRWTQWCWVWKCITWTYRAEARQ